MAKTALLLAISLSLLLAACSGGAKKTARIELTGDHLRAMVLAKDDLGPNYADFGLDPRSGPRTSEQLVEESSNPDDEALDVANFAILLGHEDSYISLPNLERHSGVLVLTDGIVLYASKQGAASDLSDSLGDTKRSFSGTTRFGTLQAFQTFKAKVGESSHGEIIRLMTNGSNFGIAGVVNLTITSIMFRRDRMVASVVLIRFDANDVRAEAKDLARKLDKRMQAVLKGEQPAGSEGSAGAVAP